MTLKTQSNTRVMTIDDGNHRLFFDRVDNEVRLFSHYTNEEGKPKMRTEKVMSFESFLAMFGVMYGATPHKGKTK